MIRVQRIDGHLIDVYVIGEVDVAGVVVAADVLDENVFDAGFVQKGVRERHDGVVVASFDDRVFNAGAGHRAVAVELLVEVREAELLLIAGDIGLGEGGLDLLVPGLREGLVHELRDGPGADAVVRRGKADELANFTCSSELGDVVIRQRSAPLGPSDEVDLLGTGGLENTVDESGDGLRTDTDVTGIGEVWQQLDPVKVGGRRRNSRVW